MRAPAAILILATAMLPAACQHRTQTLFPDTDGIVIDLASGNAVGGARVSVVGEDSETTSAQDGNFSLPAITRTDPRIPLPVSGVYRATAVVKAEGANGSRAFAPVDFVNPSTRAETAIALFMLDADAPWDAGPLPAGCEPTAEAVYVFQLLQSGQSRAVRGHLDTIDGYDFTYRQWLDRVIVRQLPRQCELPTNLLMAWIADIDAFVDGEMVPDRAD